MRARAFILTNVSTPEPGTNHGDPLVPPIGSKRPAKESKTAAPNNTFKPEAWQDHWNRKWIAFHFFLPGSLCLRPPGLDF